MRKGRWKDRESGDEERERPWDVLIEKCARVNPVATFIEVHRHTTHSSALGLVTVHS